MSKIYQVWSQHQEPIIQKVLELTRTDPKVAREDVSLIQSVLHRKAWIEEVDSETRATIRIDVADRASVGMVCPAE